MNILSAKKVRELDRLAIAGGTPGLELMENAGRGFVEVLLRYHESISGVKAVVFAGKGNNGGDGFVIARHMKKLGGIVHVVMLAGEKELKGDALANYRKLKRLSGIKITDGHSESIDSIELMVSESDFIVDAIFGTGFKGQISGRLKEIIQLVNDSGLHVIACDVPSGINGDTGEDGGGIAVNADMTITFAYPKKGLFLAPGAGYTGSIEVVDIGLGGKAGGSGSRMITRPDVRGLLKKRQKNVHKGTYGHVLVLAGSLGLTGAATLVCKAAMRTGAGLVTLGIPESLNSILEEKLTEAMTLPLAETGNKTLALEAYKSIVSFIKTNKVTVLAVGPGLTGQSETRELIRKVVGRTNLPCVLDACGINAFAGHRSELKKARAKLIITPHPGELSRLTGKEMSVIQKNRVKAASGIAGSNGLICALKGHQTVVSDGSAVFINPTGNPGMASGGTGDVLTGMIAGLLCQGPASKRLDAVIAGVYLHGLAGDIAREKMGEISLVASDVLDGIPGAIRFVKQSS